MDQQCKEHLKQTYLSENGKNPYFNLQSNPIQFPNK